MIEEGSAPDARTDAGFYEYDEDGKRAKLWPGVRETSTPVRRRSLSTDLQERMLFAEAIETIKCLDEGVLTSVPDANIGSIFGIGFPAWSGGVLQYVNQYEGGLNRFVERAKELAATYGDRFIHLPHSLSVRSRTTRTNRNITGSETAGVRNQPARPGRNSSRCHRVLFVTGR